MTRSISELNAQAKYSGKDGVKIFWFEPGDGLEAWVSHADGEEQLGVVYRASNGMGWRAAGKEGIILDDAPGTYAEKTDACCAAVEAAIVSHLKTDKP